MLDAQTLPPTLDCLPDLLLTSADKRTQRGKEKRESHRWHCVAVTAIETVTVSRGYRLYV